MNFIGSIFLILLFGGCASYDVYRNPSIAEPHAVLRFQPIEGYAKILGEMATFLETINGDRLSFLRLSDKCFLIPGENVLVVGGVSDNKNAVAYN